MRTVPKSIQDALQFFETHLPVWADDPAAIGLDAGQVDQLMALTETARATYGQARAARRAATAATDRQTQAVAAMRRFGGDLIATVRAFAEASNDQGVYFAARLAPPSDPSPLGRPKTPTDLTLTLDTAGQVALRWRGSRKGGTSFIIERSLDDTLRSWTILGVAERKSFVDRAVPTGQAGLTYRVTAVRAGGASTPTSPTTILFGTLSQVDQSAPAASLAASLAA